MIKAAGQAVDSAIKGDVATANGMPGGGSMGLTSGAGGVFQSSDFSGWTVATSGSRAQATAGDRGGQSAVTPSTFANAAGAGPGGPGGMPGGAAMVAGSFDTSTALMIVGGLVLVVLLLKRRK